MHFLIAFVLETMALATIHATVSIPAIFMPKSIPVSFNDGYLPVGNGGCLHFAEYGHASLALPGFAAEIEHAAACSTSAAFCCVISSIWPIAAAGWAQMANGPMSKTPAHLLRTNAYWLYGSSDCPESGTTD
ncbi:MAG: hypothetical protein Q8Q81_05225 [Oxalobacteraceae bacterium]|nr:hypothetical protein [Oxalobacteraceae bacterium]